MFISSTAYYIEFVFTKYFCQKLCVFNHLNSILFKFCVLCFFQSYRDPTNGMKMWPTLESRKYCGVKIAFKLFSDKNNCPPRATECFMSRHCYYISIRERRFINAG